VSLLPTAVPEAAGDGMGLSTDGLWQSSFSSMASPVRLQLAADAPAPPRRHAEVRALFAEVERQCTRFDPASDLMRANAAGDEWQEVGVHCFEALQAAAAAHRRTAGRFDPRVLAVLEDLGYRGTLPVASGTVRTDAPRLAPTPAAGPWRPRFDPGGRQVAVGTVPVDLGGIGKGLALRWAADLLRTAGCTSFLLEAGGDCVYGAGPGGSGWRLAVEDPAGATTPIAVLEVADGACATSSTRLLHWLAGDRPVHHLIDPSTGMPGGGRLRAVTVVAGDPAEAEVWTKVLFLAGEDGIADAAGANGLAALWVDDAGTVRSNAAMRPHVIWERR
jgi:thiamine biosynthesis lipoprotein